VHEHHAVGDRPAWHAGRTVVISWLVLLTILSLASSFRGLEPLDARTGQVFPGARLEMPIWASVVEPLTAPFTIVAGASDYRAAAISTLCWIFAAVFAGFYWAYRRRPTSSWTIDVANSLVFASGFTVLSVFYLFVALLIPLPSWSLVMDDPAAGVVADLHSHTLASHDGLVSSRQNLSMHQSRGYQIVAFTEHYPVRKRLQPAVADPPPRSQHHVEAISGLEFYAWLVDRGYYFLLLGIPTDAPVAEWLKPPEDMVPHLAPSPVHNLANKVHQANGAILAMGQNLRRDDIQRFIDAGVDGFEIANFGHPEFTWSTVQDLVKAQETRGVALVASSDWHGWGGLFKTWTIFRLDAVAGNTADLVVDALRRRDSSRIVPVVSQMFVQPSTFRVVFAPFAEAVRYGTELSFARLVAWWIWMPLVIAAARWLRRWHLNLAGVILNTAQVMLGAGAIARGMMLISLWSTQGAYRFPAIIGIIAIAAGMAALAVTWINRCFLHRSIVASPWIGPRWEIPWSRFENKTTKP
jgi:hypothetical protein